mmetsp:Transcript_30103/g.45891  ORF Transcript_30103/g.45891 Transcript_30103/m.45891 type:complete len:218 (+) Transcript_30103:34-687(+)
MYKMSSLVVFLFISLLSLHFRFSAGWQTCLFRRDFALTIMHQNLRVNDDDADPVSQLPLMEAELEALKSTQKKSEVEENRLSDLTIAIQDSKNAAEFGIRRSQVEFYNAFSEQDLGAMEQLWSTQPDVRCIHPGIACLDGHKAVIQSWALIFANAPKFTIQPSRTRINICGQTALCSCVEETPDGGKLECLNVYRRERGTWKMILHMASPIIITKGE